MDLRSSPRPKITTIEEGLKIYNFFLIITFSLIRIYTIIEKAKLKNRFGKNKLAPLDDNSDIDLYKSSKNSPSSWAVTDKNTKLRSNF